MDSKKDEIIAILEDEIDNLRNELTNKWGTKYRKNYNGYANFRK